MASGRERDLFGLAARAAQAFQHLIAENPRTLLDCRFIQREQSPVAHYHTPVNNYGFDVESFGGINEVGIDIVERYLIQ